MRHCLYCASQAFWPSEAAAMRVDGAAWVRLGEDCSRGAESASATGRQKRQATPILFIHAQKGDLQPEGPGMFCLHGSTRLIRDSPDDSRTGADVHGFPAFRQDRSEVRTAWPRLRLRAPSLPSHHQHDDDRAPCRDTRQAAGTVATCSLVRTVAVAPA